MTTRTSRRIVETLPLAQRGDEEALRELSDGIRDITKFVYTQETDRGFFQKYVEFDDYHQVVCYRVWRGLHTYNPKRANPMTWVQRIARNEKNRIFLSLKRRDGKYLNNSDMSRYVDESREESRDPTWCPDLDCEDNRLQDVFELRRRGLVYHQIGNALGMELDTTSKMGRDIRQGLIDFFDGLHPSTGKPTGMFKREKVTA